MTIASICLFTQWFSIKSKTKLFTITFSKVIVEVALLDLATSEREIVHRGRDHEIEVRRLSLLIKGVISRIEVIETAARFHFLNFETVYVHF